MSEFRKHVRLLTLRRILGMAWDLTTYERSQIPPWSKVGTEVLSDA